MSHVIVTSLCIEDDPYYKGSVPITKEKAQELVNILGIEKWDKQCEEVGTVIPLKTVRYSCGTCGTALSQADHEADMCPTCENLAI